MNATLPKSVIQAIEDGDGKKLAKLLSRNIGGRLPKELLAVGLLESASKGNEGCVSTLLKAGASPAATDSEGRTALLLLVEKAGATPPIAKELLQAGCPVDHVTMETKQCALHVCSRRGYQVCAKLLIHCGAAIDLRDIHGNTPLSLAARYGHMSICKSLIGAGARTGRYNDQGETILHQTARRGCHQVTLTLLEAGADPNHRDHRRQTPLLVACRFSNTDVVKVLISCQAEINSQDINLGRTGLHWAAKHGDLECIEALLEAGAHLDPRDKDWQTPFLVALLAKQVTAAEYLLRAGADITATDKLSMTGLHIASRDGLASMIPKLLLNREGCHGVDINLKGAGGKTALMLAAGEGHLETVLILLRYGSKVNGVDRSQCSALVHCLLSSVPLLHENKNITTLNHMAILLIKSNANIEEACNLYKALRCSSWYEQLVEAGEMRLSSKVRGIEQDRLYTPVEIAYVLDLQSAGKLLLKVGARVPDTLSSRAPRYAEDYRAHLGSYDGLRRLLVRQHAAQTRVPSLKAMCRRRVLSCLGTTVKEKLKTLPPLEYQLRRYLEFSELDADFCDDDDGDQSDAGATPEPIKRTGFARSTISGIGSRSSPSAPRVLQRPRPRTDSTSSTVSSTGDPTNRQSFVRRTPTKYTVSGRINSSTPSPQSPTVDYSNIFKKITPSPTTTPKTTPTPLSTKTTPLMRRPPVVKDRTVSTDNGYVSTDSETCSSHAGSISSRPRKARSTVLSMEDMFTSSPVRGGPSKRGVSIERGVANDRGVSTAAAAARAHRDALNEEAVRYNSPTVLPLDTDYNNNNNNNNNNDSSNSSLSGGGAGFKSSFDDMLNPLLDIIAAEARRSPSVATPPPGKRDTPPSNGKHRDTTSTRQATVNVGRDWAHSLRSSSRSIAPTIPLGRTTPTSHRLRPPTTRSPMDATTRASQLELSTRLSQVDLRRSSEPVAASPRRRVTSASEPIQSRLQAPTPRSRGARTDNPMGASLLTLSSSEPRQHYRSRLSSESNLGGGAPFTRGSLQLSSVRMSRSKAPPSPKSPVEQRPTSLLNYSTDRVNDNRNPFQRCSTFPANKTHQPPTDSSPVGDRGGKLSLKDSVYLKSPRNFSNRINEVIAKFQADNAAQKVTPQTLPPEHNAKGHRSTDDSEQLFGSQCSLASNSSSITSNSSTRRSMLPRPIPRRSPASNVCSQQATDQESPFQRSMSFRY